MPADPAPLLRPLTIRSTTLRNRIVMSPMTRQHSPGGVPGPDVAAYYRRRAAGGTGLVITEGVAIDHPTAVDSTRVPKLHGAAAQQGWRRVIDDVHAAGGVIIPQLWHVGPLWGAMHTMEGTPMRPSGLWGTPGRTTYSAEYVAASEHPTTPMSEADIEQVIAAYARAAGDAVALGFDGVALHGGHGYLLDAFLWASTNHRTDRWGGDAARRTRFPVEVVRAVRAVVGEDLPIFFRFSQHKQQDYTARLAETPDELGAILGPLVDAGVDVLDASARYFDAPAFSGSELTLAGWAKKLTGAKSMAVGSVGLSSSLRDPDPAVPVDIDGLLERLARDEFDLAAIGRLHLADPALAATLRSGAELPAFDVRRHAGTLH